MTHLSRRRIFCDYERNEEPCHVLARASALADWTSGTAPVPYFERLAPRLKDQFLAAYRTRLVALYGDGPVFYPFKRTLFAAGKSG